MIFGRTPDLLFVKSFKFVISDGQIIAMGSPLKVLKLMDELHNCLWAQKMSQK